MVESGRARFRRAAGAASVAFLVGGCGGAADPAPREPMPVQRPVAAIIAERAPEWMALPGVVGVYESLTDAGAPCLKVMVKEATPELRVAIPESVEGYPVVLRETGPVAPRGGGGAG